MTPRPGHCFLAARRPQALGSDSLQDSKADCGPAGPVFPQGWLDDSVPSKEARLPKQTISGTAKYVNVCRLHADPLPNPGTQVSEACLSCNGSIFAYAPSQIHRTRHGRAESDGCALRVSHAGVCTAGPRPVEGLQDHRLWLCRGSCTQARL